MAGMAAGPNGEPDARRKNRFKWAGCAAAAVLVAIAAVVANAGGESCFRFAPPCPFHWLTGLHCPGCGTGRAVYALLHGDIAGAWAMNKLMVVSIPFVLWMLAGSLPPVKQINSRLARVLPPKTVWLIPAIVVLYWILRNVPYYPFTLLAPRG